MSDDDYHYGDYGTESPEWSVPGMTDAEQIAGLRPRQGDGVIRRHNSNARWGSTARVDFAGSSLPNPHTSAALIDTNDFDTNLPIAYQLRFALNAAGPFSPVFPVGASSGAVLTIRKSIDFKAGVTEEQVTLFPGDRQIGCIFICRRLVVTIDNLSISGVDPGDNITLFVQAAACPVTNVDCNEITGRNSLSYSLADENFVAADINTVTLLPANANRAQFLIQNTSTQGDLLICFGPGADFFNPTGSIILPRGASNIYESPLNGYTGIVTGVWNNPVTEGSPDGGALVTEGTFI